MRLRDPNLHTRCKVRGVVEEPRRAVGELCDFGRHELQVHLALMIGEWCWRASRQHATVIEFGEALCLPLGTVRSICPRRCMRLGVSWQVSQNPTDVIGDLLEAVARVNPVAANSVLEATAI
jgi:hypothetical protein